MSTSGVEAEGGLTRRAPTLPPKNGAADDAGAVSRCSSAVDFAAVADLHDGDGSAGTLD